MGRGRTKTAIVVRVAAPERGRRCNSRRSLSRSLIMRQASHTMRRLIVCLLWDNVTLWKPRMLHITHFQVPELILLCVYSKLDVFPCFTSTGVPSNLIKLRTTSTFPDNFGVPLTESEVAVVLSPPPSPPHHRRGVLHPDCLF